MGNCHSVTGRIQLVYGKPKLTVLMPILSQRRLKIQKLGVLAYKVSMDPNAVQKHGQE